MGRTHALQAVGVASGLHLHNPFHTLEKQTKELLFDTNEDKSIYEVDNNNTMI